MKRIIRSILTLGLISLVGCNDNDNDHYGQGNENPVIDITLKSDKLSDDVIILEQGDIREQALLIEWSDAPDMGPDYTVEYVYRLDQVENEFGASQPEIKDGVYSRSYTVEELNELVQQLGVHPGEIGVMNARISCIYTGPKYIYPALGLIQFKVMPFAYASAPLYLFGSATKGGTDPDQAERMTEVVNGLSYSWKGVLGVGGFKFLLSRTSELPSYNKGKGDTELVYRESASEPDDYFMITETDPQGRYEMSVSLKTKSILLTKIPVPDEQLYLVGNGCSAGWREANGVPFTKDPYKDEFTLVTELKAGELKILVSNAYGAFQGPTYKPTFPDRPIMSSETSYMVSNEQPDNKWIVQSSEAGTYKITVDVANESVTFERQ